MASEMSFENVNGQTNEDERTTDACHYYKLTCEPSAEMGNKT